MNGGAAFWWDLLGRLTLESSALIALAGIVSRKMSAAQQRKVWQVALTALLLLFVAEGTGLHQRMRFLSAQTKRAPISRRLTIEVLPAREIAVRSAAQPHTAPGSSIAGWLPGIIWLAISGFLLVRSFGSRLLFVALKGRRPSLNDPVLRQKVEALARPMNLRARIHLSESAHLAGPIAFGFLRRCICVPENFARTFAAREQEVMLAHELAHLAVRDPLWYAIVDVAAALFWFNPLVWFGRRQFQAACESAADEASLLVSEGAPTLAECLVQFGKRLAGANSYGWIGVEGSRFRSGLGRRVNRLLTLQEERWRPLPRVWTTLTYSAGALLLGALLASSAAYGSGRGHSLAEHLWLLTAAQVAQPAEPPTNTANNALPLQLTIEAKFVELSDPSDAMDLRNLVIGGENWGTNSFWGILPPSKYRDLIKRLETRLGVDILAAPKITTLSGRQAQIKVVDVKYIVTGLDDSGVATNAPKPIADRFELGPILDVIPVARGDGLSIDITLITSIREFVGYDLEPPYVDSGPPKPLTPVPLREYAGERNANANDPVRPALAQVTPRPTFRLRQAQTRACVWDGQTVVLYLRPKKDPSASPNIKYTPSGKTCFLFVTPVLIDPAGNRVHDESDMPFVEQTIPE